MSKESKILSFSKSESRLSARKKSYDRTQVGDLYWFEAVESATNIAA